MTFSGCDTSPTVDCCSFSIGRTQSPEKLGRVGERSLGWTDCRAATLTFFFFFLCLRGEGARRTRTLVGERGLDGDKPILRWCHSNCTPLRCMQKRDSVSVPRDTQKWEQEHWASPFTVSGSERIAPYRLGQSRVEAYTMGFSQTSIFIPSPFGGRTNGAQWRQGESKFLPCFS